VRYNTRKGKVARILRKGKWGDNFPYDIEDDVGEILQVQKEAPGVYFIFTKKNNPPSGRQYYIVEKSSPAISMPAKKYGKPLPHDRDLLSFDIDSSSAGQKIVAFEIVRFKMRNGCSDVDKNDLTDTACAGMETNPEYFGYYPVPDRTPWGRLIRYKVLSNGIYWIETDRLETVLAICDIYEDDFFDGTREGAARLADEKDQNLWAFSYLFYPYKSSCIPLFELLPNHREWIDSHMINRAALMNAIWETNPEYAAAYNANEIMGLHDEVGSLLRSFGETSTPNISVNRTIAITPDAGTNFCTLFE